MSFVADLVALVDASSDGRLRCPFDWKRAPLGYVADVTNGFPFSSTAFGAVGAPVIRIRDVERGSTDTRFAGPIPEGYWVERGDLLVGMDGDFASAFWRSDRALLNQRVCKLTPKPGALDGRYLGYILPAYLQLINANTPSVTVKHLSSRTLAAIPIPLPGIDVQRRLADRIDELLTEVEDGEAALEQARGDLATWRKALLKAAVTGELTADWRAANPPTETGADLLARILAERRTLWVADPRKKGKCYVEPEGPNTNQLPEIPEGWIWTNVDQISTRVTKGSSPGWQGFEYLPEGILFVRSQNVGWGKLLIDERVYVGAAFNEVESKAVVSSGDILLNIVGASIGRACRADARLVGANTNQAVAGIRPVMAEVADFLVSWLISPMGQAAVFENVVETARANLSLEQVRAIPVPLPPASELDVIIDAFDAAADAQAAMLIDVGEQAERATTLRRSILAAAFRGELIA